MFKVYSLSSPLRLLELVAEGLCSRVYGKCMRPSLLSTCHNITNLFRLCVPFAQIERVVNCHPTSPVFRLFQIRFSEKLRLRILSTTGAKEVPLHLNSDCWLSPD